MNRTFLIFTHELAATVRRAGFIVFTLLWPLLAMLAVGIIKLATASQSPHGPSPENVGYVDGTGIFNGFTEQGAFTFVRFDTVEAATQSLVSGGITEYIVIPPDYLDTLTASRFVSRKEFVTPGAMTGAVQSFLAGNLLAGRVSPEAARAVQGTVTLLTTKLAADGSIAADQGGAANAILPLLFCLLLVLSLVFSTQYLIQGLVEEKENRLMEVLVSRVTHRELLFGKILGLGSSALVQVAIWLVTMPLVLLLGQSLVGGILRAVHVPAWFFPLALLYFVLSLLLFSSLSASVGAISPTAREGGQLAVLYTLFPIVPLWLMSLLLAFPRHPAWVVLSIFPLTAPVMVIERLAVTDVPVWQIATSLGTLAVCAIGALFLSGRVFRSYLLMYGKRPGLRMFLRGLRTTKEGTR